MAEASKLGSSVDKCDAVQSINQRLLSYFDLELGMQVLVLVERLHSITAAFDKCRALRYQQSLARELRQHRKAPKQQVSLQLQHALQSAAEQTEGACHGHRRQLRSGHCE